MIRYRFTESSKAPRRLSRLRYDGTRRVVRYSVAN